LSGISGPDLQARLTESGYRIFMIMITAFPEKGFRVRAMGAGAVCFLNNPVTGRDLVCCIKSTLHTTLQESSDE
jgi:FixJ family two-component response regulator